MIRYEDVFTYFAGTYPDIEAVNSFTGISGDGTEFIAALVTENWGFHQALMAYAYGGTDVRSGVPEGAGASQLITAIQKGNNIGPGFVVPYYLTSTALTGHRILPLNGQGVLIASYPDLTDATYVGDGNNAAVAAGGGAFYRADDAAGTIPNTAGIYLILPESRGYTLRGLDLAATVDPLGAGRFLGDNQLDDYKSHIHQVYFGNDSSGLGVGNTTNTVKASNSIVDSIASGGSETRMKNVSINFGITY